MKPRSSILAPAVLLCSVLAAPFPAVAQSRPAPQRVLSRGAADRGEARPAANARGREHVLYGRIDALRASLLSLRTRGGDVVRVDAEEALRSGNYSAPLFVGKVVVVRGVYDATRTLRADSVIRMGQLDPTTPADR